jgi:hypothetical protein
MVVRMTAGLNVGEVQRGQQTGNFRAAAGFSYGNPLRGTTLAVSCYVGNRLYVVLRSPLTQRLNMEVLSKETIRLLRNGQIREAVHTVLDKTASDSVRCSDEATVSVRTSGAGEVSVHRVEG